MGTEPVICSPGAWLGRWEPLRVIVIVGGFWADAASAAPDAAVGPV
jgi:hypothetical protein